MASKKTTYRCKNCKAERQVPADYMGTPSCKVCRHNIMEEVKDEQGRSDQGTGADIPDGG